MLGPYLGRFLDDAEARETGNLGVRHKASKAGNHQQLGPAHERTPREHEADRRAGER